ncbi:uncharacterized protein LOC110636696 [Hevea brasiliensis]|uniref:uncharacterized protein LOC110636696 n=1 Tax=Hevea brasiliensis TaxID=3981 RepID=UPI0025E05F08|nr:uncharacterized protein LOC110636696 [Hevea brasiliensis]
MMKKTKGQNVILEELQAYMSAGRSKEVSNSGEGGSRSENVGFQSILGNGMELVTFDGKEPRAWLRRCEKYFEIYKVPIDQKVPIASLFLVDRADAWFHNWNRGGVHSWEEFEKGICSRFGDEGLEDLVEGFIKLRQEGSLEEYQDEFEELRIRIERLMPELGESYFLFAFMGGLKDEIRMVVRMMKPVSLSQAIEVARLQEQLLEVNKKPKNTSNFSKPFRSQSTVPLTPYQTNYLNQYAKPYQTYQNPPRPPNFGKPSPTIIKTQSSTNSPNPLPISTLSSVYKPTNSFSNPIKNQPKPCYRCGDKYFPGHQCKQKSLNAICAVEKDHDGGEEEWFEAGMEMEERENMEDNTLSVHALEGSHGIDTIRMLELHKNRQLVILIDSGSTTSFLDKRIAKELKLELVSTLYTAITMVDGRKLGCDLQCQQFKWKMDNNEFNFDFKIIELGGLDMILGVDWLKKHNPVLFDFEASTITITVEGRSVVLHGIGEGKLQFGLWYFANILRKDEPQGLPPFRSHNHATPLQHDAQPFNIRPYRYPHYQKTEIETLIKDMLSSSIIQPSTSPYSSPVLLVRKKDGTWRFCVDYRRLNDLTVKDKFPIPIIDDLLDELHGAMIFSKIDRFEGWLPSNKDEGG